MDIVQLIPRRQALRLMGISSSTGWRMERSDPSFPRKVETSSGRFALRADEVQIWIDSRPRIAQASAPAAATAARKAAASSP